MRSLRVVLVMGRTERGANLIRFAKLPVKPLHDRVREFEQQTARIEAQLAVLEEDTERAKENGSPAGWRLRLRHFYVTRAYLIVHVRAAIKLCRRKSALAVLQDQLVAIETLTDEPPDQFDKADLGGESVNLDRLADVLFLFHEVHGRLAPSRKKDGEGREEGVA